MRNHTHISRMLLRRKETPEKNLEIPYLIHLNFRRHHLISRASAMEMNGDYKQRRTIKQLIITEHQKSLHSSIELYFNPTTKSSYSKIQISIINKNWNNISKDKYEKWETIIDSNEIERVLIKRNIARFSQTEGTLFTTTLL